jgi:hypothetical protein
MDPNAAVAQAREAAEALARLDVPGDGMTIEELEGEARDLRDAFVALDEWLTGGGFLPYRWAIS